MTRINEGRKEFLAWAANKRHPQETDRLLKDFLANRQKYPSPQNNMDWWVQKKRPVDLRMYIDNFVSKTKKEKEERYKGVDKLFEDKKWLVLRIKTYEAAKHYGKGSKWCICGEYPEHETRGQEFFDSYLRHPYCDYIIFINKQPKDPMKDGKYMVCIYRRDHNQRDIFKQSDDKIKFIPDAPTVPIPGVPSVGQFTIVDGVLTDAQVDIETIDVVIPDGVISINKKVFMKSCLRSIELPDSLEEIGTGAFMQSSLERIVIPDGVTTLGNGIFCSCKALSSVELGAGINVLPDLLFGYSTGLTIRVKGRIEEISDTAFKGVRKEEVLVQSYGDNPILEQYCNEHDIGYLVKPWSKNTKKHFTEIKVVGDDEEEL